MIQPQPIDVSEEMDVFTQRMQDHGYKITPQRLKLAEWIFKVHEHFSVYDLVWSLQRDGKKISVATAYRMVQTLIKLELLQENDFGQGAKYYEHIHGHVHHDHIICNQCKNIIEFTNDTLETLKHKIAEEQGFEMTFHSLNIYGDCTQVNCSNKSK